MTFLYPLGLLGLLAIPLLVLIYILKNKHTEQVIASTYLWTLSERFLKRKKPLSRITGIVSLILQILIVTCISFAVAHPVFTLKGRADDYIFILDGSGSMSYETNGKTRFEVGKDRIADLIEDSANGSAYTLIHVGESTGVLYEEIEDRTQALTVLQDAKPSTLSTGLADAKGVAQECFAEKPSSKIYLVTDKTYADGVENVELISLSTDVENYAVADLKHTIEGGKLVVAGKVCSYKSDASLDLLLEIYNTEGAVVESVPLSAMAVSGGEEKEFRIEAETTTFDKFKVTVQNEDGLPLDNESIYHNVISSGVGEILIVSEDGFFLEKAFAAVYGQGTTKTQLPKDYREGTKGYRLYVFEGFSPQVLPSDGQVWFVNPISSVANAGFSVQGNQKLPQPTLMQYNNSTSTRVQLLLEGTNKDKIYFDEYVKCNFYRSFHTLLSYDGNPLVFAGTNSYNNREVVFAFDFHKADFVLKFDFMVLFSNLLDFTFPAILEETSFYCGETLPVNVLANCTTIRVDTPSGKVLVLSTDSDLAEFTVTEVGTYTITSMIGGNPQKRYAYGNLPKAERAPMVNEGTFAISGTPSEERRDGRYDDLIILFIILAVIFIADWAVYCYEQYQLR